MRHACFLLAAVLLGTLTGRPCCAETTLTLSPSQGTLHGKTAQQRLIVTEVIDGKAADRTRDADFRSETPGIVQVSPRGIVTPVGDGAGVVTARVNGKQVRATFQVRDSQTFLPVRFESDIQPILTHAGCNQGACHGKARGQNGFQLSLFGFDRDFDYAAIAHESRGRRIFPAAPDDSLLLRKPTGRMPHGGGKRLDPNSLDYELLRRWIGAGLPRDAKDTPTVERITLEPTDRTLTAQAQQQLLVTAHFSDGSARDVTQQTTFQSNESVIASVNAGGLIKAGPLPGETAVMARYMEKFAVCAITIPLPGSVPAELHARLPRQNFIDEHVWAKLQKLGITPSEQAGDAAFLRRAYLDVIGRLPAPEESRRFLEARDVGKRARLVDELLQRPEYADYWASKWADLLRPNPYRVGIKAVHNLDAWLRDAFRRNKPYDQFVRELVTAQGSTWRNGAAVVFRDRREPAELTTITAQLFLGIRLDCARCHHHPFESWSQDDFYSFAAYFARIGRKGTGLSEPISGGEEIMFTAEKGTVKHPVTRQEMAPRPLFGKAAAVSDETDPRRILAEWMTSDANPYFAKVIVNRVWADLMGRGIVDPVDDLRASNPPTNGPLLDALALDFCKSGYDLKKLLRTIMTSHVYGLSSLPNERNASDTRNYSRHYRQRLRGETLLDMVSDITGVPETFAAMPPGARAAELWTVRSPSVFLDTFGRPDPNQDPPCERTPDTTLVQALHLMNAPNLHAKVTSDQSRAAKLAASTLTPAEVVDTLYLLAYCRPPTDSERSACVGLFSREGANRRQVIEDLLWAMLNTPEFVFKD